MLTHHVIHHCRENCLSDRLSVLGNKIVDSSEFTAVKFLIYLFRQLHLLLHCRYIDLKKDFLKENKKPLTGIKTTSKHKNV